MQKRIAFPKSFWIGIVLLLLWMSFTASIHALLNAFYDWTTFLLLLVGLLVIGVVLDGRLIRKAMIVKIDRSRVGIVIFLFSMQEIIYFYQLFKPYRSVGADALFQRTQAGGIVIILGFLIFKLIRPLLKRPTENE